MSAYPTGSLHSLVMNSGGGYDTINETGPQFWSGSAAAPTFVPGTYQMLDTDYSYSNSATLTIASAGTIYWSVMAQSGAVGSQGPQGLQGIEGLPGMTGLTGPVGPAGAASIVPGPAGPSGPTGPAGPTGSTGPAGTGVPNVYVNSTYTRVPINGSAGIASPGVIQLNNLPAGSYLVTGNVNLSYGIEPDGHSFVNPWCTLYAYDGGASIFNVGQPALTTMVLPYTADHQSVASASLVVSGWATLTSSTNLVYIGCSINGPWNPTTHTTLTQTITAMQAAVTRSVSSAVNGTD